MKWNKTKEVLPDFYTECLVWPAPSDYCLIAQLDRKGWYYNEYITGFGNEVVRLKDVTHWMYLPDKPEDD